MATGPAPTYAQFLARCTFPEAFSGIAQADVEAVLQDAADYLAAAFGDRAVLPILEWDGSCLRAAVRLAGRDLMGYRGYDSGAGSDKEIVALAEKAETFRDGIKDKTEHPYFVDSHSGPVPDAPRVMSSRRSDDWITRRGSGGRCC